MNIIASVVVVVVVVVVMVVVVGGGVEVVVIVNLNKYTINTEMRLCFCPYSDWSFLNAGEWTFNPKEEGANRSTQRHPPTSCGTMA